MNSSKLLLRVLLVWLIADAAFLAIGTRWNWFLVVGVRGLVIDFLRAGDTADAGKRAADFLAAKPKK